MLCPEVWNFDPPPFSVSSKFYETEEEIFRAIKHQQFNHLVSLTFPNTLQLPNDLIDTALDDSQFYRIHEVPAVELFNKEFVDLFVRKGRLTALSLGDLPDQDSIVITSCGKLIFSLSKSTYHKLGVESTFAKYDKTFVRKYFFVLDFTSDCSESIKKCEQVGKKLAAHNDLLFDIVLAWEPESSNVCPSSIAFYFSKKGYFVKTCDVIYKHRIRYNVAVPRFEEEGDIPELIEWLGAHNLDCDMSSDSYISSMKISENNEIFGQVMQLSFTGLISHNRLKNIISQINKYIKEKTPITWISLTVQGFQDKILKVQNKHLCVSDGDHHCTIFFRWNKPSLIYTFQDRKSLSPRRFHFYLHPAGFFVIPYDPFNVSKLSE